jgi:hypothetical protein
MHPFQHSMIMYSHQYIPVNVDKQSNHFVCLLFVFLALQTIVVVFSTTQWPGLASSFSRFLDYTQRRATVGRIPLGEWSIRRRDLYLTKHNTHNRQTFEPAISAGERPKIYALDRKATGTGQSNHFSNRNPEMKHWYPSVYWLL